MMNTSLHITRSAAMTFIMAALLWSSATYAHDHEKYDSIASKYRNEHAVYTDVTNRLVIKEEDGKLVATTYVTMEKLFISDQSLRTNSVDYFFHSTFNELQNMDAAAYLRTGDSYKRVRCYDFAQVRPRDFIFYDDNRAIEVLYSGLQKKSITETRYSLEHTDIHMLEPFELQENIPIVNATYEVVAPAYVHMNFVLKGDNTDWLQQSKEEKNGKIIYRFTASDVPAFKSYDNVPSPRYYKPHVIPYITSYQLPDATKPVEMLSNPDGLYKYLYPYVKNLNMKDDTAIDRIVAEITKDDVLEKDKARHIYKWVQKNIHYIAFEYGLEGFRPREASLVYKRKYGDCKDMSAILVAMYHRAGIEAYFTWIGTRRLPYNNQETPLSLVSNHMICAAKVGDQWIFVDGTDPALPFGANREDVQGKEAMIAIDAKNYKIVTIPEESPDKNRTIDSTFISFTDYKISGSVKIAYQGYPAWDLSYRAANTTADDKEKMVKEITERGSNKYEQQSYDLALNKTQNRDAYINANFTVDNYVKRVGKQCYINMNLQRSFDTHIASDRKIPYFNDYKQKTTEVVVLDIPKGYRIAHLPKDAQGSADGLWNYKISYKAGKDKITLTKEYELNTLSVSAARFAEHNKLVDGLKKLYKESVVLTAK